MAITRMKLKAKSEEGYRTEVYGSQTMIIDQPAPTAMAKVQIHLNIF